MAKFAANSHTAKISSSLCAGNSQLRELRNAEARENSNNINICRGHDSRDGLPRLIGRNGKDGDWFKRSPKREWGGLRPLREGHLPKCTVHGRTGGSHYSDKGGAASYLCMPQYMIVMHLEYNDMHRYMELITK